jgi:ketosteroid isomerase-like protein
MVITACRCSKIAAASPSVRRRARLKNLSRRPRTRRPRRRDQHGHAYDNHFVSVITVNEHVIMHWRDCLDPVAVFEAIGWPPGPA